MRIVLLSVAALALFACGPGRTTFARHPGAAATFDRTASEPQAVEIADKVIAAAGGAQKWSSAKQLRWSQVVTNEGKEVIAGEQAWDRWNARHHGRARREGGDMIVMRGIYDEDGHAFIDASEGAKKRLKRIEDGKREAVAAARERWEFDTAILFMPFLLEEPGAKLSYAGEALGTDDKPADAIKVTFDPKDRTRTASYHVIVNRETNMIDRIEIQKASQPENTRMGYQVKTWIEADGMKFPGSIENLGLKGEVVTFSNMKISEPDEDLYVPPLG